MHVFLLIMLCLSAFIHGRELERELTIEVKPGQVECFYQDIKAEETLEVEYQVIDGGQGNLDINFFIQNMHGNLLIQDIKKSDESHKTKMSEDGDYKICWDNKISRINTKIVFFAILVTGLGNDGLWDTGFDSVAAAIDDYEMQVEDIQDSMNLVRSHLSRARVLQDQLKAHEARDRNVVEHNYSRVNYFSLFNMAAMILTGILQVFLVRSLFDEKSRLHALWKKKS